MKKIISILLTFTMLLGITLSLPMSVSAVATDMVSSGSDEYYHDKNGSWGFELINNGTAYRLDFFYSGLYDGYIDVLEIPSVFNGLPVTEIGSHVFSLDDNIFKIIIPDSVTIIRASAFDHAFSLGSIVIPNSVTTIEDHAFSHCINLCSVVIPDSVTTIGRDVFSNCTSLESVVLSNSLTTITEHTFACCTNLRSIVIPDSVTTISGSAFLECINLISIVIPNSVTNIYPFAFDKCTSLYDVYYEGSTEEWFRISINYANDPLINANIHIRSFMAYDEYGA